MIDTANHAVTPLACAGAKAEITSLVRRSIANLWHDRSVETNHITGTRLVCLNHQPGAPHPRSAQCATAVPISDRLLSLSHPAWFSDHLYRATLSRCADHALLQVAQYYDFARVVACAAFYHPSGQKGKPPSFTADSLANTRISCYTNACQAGEIPQIKREVAMEAEITIEELERVIRRLLPSRRREVLRFIEFLEFRDEDETESLWQAVEVHQAYRAAHPDEQPEVYESGEDFL
jgi:hypothetical protein